LEKASPLLKKTTRRSLLHYHADEDGSVNLLTPLMGQKLIPGVTQVSRWWESLVIE